MTLASSIISLRKKIQEAWVEMAEIIIRPLGPQTLLSLQRARMYAEVPSLDPVQLGLEPDKWAPSCFHSQELLWLPMVYALVLCLPKLVSDPPHP